MIILAVDSTAQTASISICNDKKPIALYSINSGLNHSETLLPMIENALKNAKMSIQDIDMFAISAGPGSFTGVRIGVSLIKGLAFGKGKKCIGVSTLEALAYNMIGFNGIICAVMDARREQVYTALFRSDGTGIERICDDRALSIGELEQELEKVRRDGEKIYICGDGYELVKSHIKTVLCDTPELLREQNAYSTAQAALMKYSENIDGDYSDKELKPIYLRLPQAERERLEKSKNSNEDHI